MHDQQADIKNIFGKAFYTRRESKISFDMLIVGHLVFTSDTTDSTALLRVMIPLKI